MRILLLMLITTVFYGKEISFMGISFGMTQEEILLLVKDTKDLELAEDVLLKQLIPPTPYVLVLKSFRSPQLIKKVFVDFLDYKSYQITVFLSPKHFSFYTLSETLLDKYGRPDNRSSIKVTWFTNEAKNQCVTLEFPATIKFTDISSLQTVVSKQNKILETKDRESVDYNERQRILQSL